MALACVNVIDGHMSPTSSIIVFSLPSSAFEASRERFLIESIAPAAGRAEQTGSRAAKVRPKRRWEAVNGAAAGGHTERVHPSSNGSRQFQKFWLGRGLGRLVAPALAIVCLWWEMYTAVPNLPPY